MAVSQRRIEGYFEAASLRWGKKNCFTVDTIADSSGSLGGDHFLITAKDADGDDDLYYVWFNTGSSSDPAVAGRTGIEVAITNNDSAATVATKIKTEIDSDATLPFKVLAIASDLLTFENRFIGALDVANGAGTSGFTLATLVDGVGLDLGKTAGPIELAFETTVQELKSNQTGAIVADEFYTGAAVTVSAELLEVTKARFDLLMREVVGGSVTPGGGTEVSGLGESKLYRSLNELGGMLIIHPIRLASSDKSSDVVLWKCAPKPQSLNFDGESAQVMPVEFTAYLDASVNTAINLFAKGDWTQTGLEA
jgi:hypothetical protein